MKKIFAENILGAIANESENIRSPVSLTGMLAIRGSAYNEELMIVGRAGNGWTLMGEFENGIKTAELKDAGTRERFTNAVCRSVAGNPGECPMSWVTNQWGPNENSNTKLSPFGG